MLFENNKGFTLIELIVVVVIVGVLAGSAILGFVSYRATERQRIAEKIVEELEYARALSSVYDNKVFVKFYKDDNNNVSLVYEKNADDEDIEIRKTNLCGSEHTLYATRLGIAGEVTDTGIDISFNKASGEFDSGFYCSEITVDGDSSAKVLLIMNTGKSVLESES